MRITYLHQYFNTPAMSGGTRSYELGRRLVKLGHEVNLVTSARSQARARDWYQTVEDGMTVHWLPVPYSNAMSYPQRIRAFLRFAMRSASKAAAIPSDIIFATSTPLTIALPAVYASRRRRVPMVFEVRDLWPELPIAVGALKNPVLIALARQLERFAYRNAAHVIALSPGMRDGVARAGVQDDVISVIPNAADIALFQGATEDGARFRAQHEWLRDRRLIVYLGTLGRINGVGYLARLAASVAKQDPEVRFLVVGTGGDAEAVKREAAELGVLDRNFFMLPPIPKEQVPVVLAAADMASSLFVDLPEMRNNSANKFFDALAAGKAIVINYAGWHKDLLEQSGAGISLHGLEVETAASRVVSRLHDSGWMKAASARAFELARTEFDRDTLALQLERVLKDTSQMPVR